MAPIHHGPANMSDRRLHICLILETHRMMDGTQEQGKRRFFGLNVTLVVSRLYTEERESPIVAHSRMKDGQQTWQAGAGQQTYIYIFGMSYVSLLLDPVSLYTDAPSICIENMYSAPPPPLM